jgi:hypothetical protein
MDLPPEHRRLKTREPFHPSRLDIQRRHLEHNKMYHLNTMAIEQVQANLDRDLAVRQQVALARNNHLTTTARFRHAIARFLVSTGERIKPEIDPVREPQLNA